MHKVPFDFQFINVILNYLFYSLLTVISSTNPQKFSSCLPLCYSFTTLLLVQWKCLFTILAFHLHVLVLSVTVFSKGFRQLVTDGIAFLSSLAYLPVTVPLNRLRVKEWRAIAWMEVAWCVWFCHLYNLRSFSRELHFALFLCLFM